jgi:hypothetical protein
MRLGRRPDLHSVAGGGICASVLAIASLLVALTSSVSSPQTGPGVGPGHPAFWADRLGFSEDQYAAMARLEKSTGVTQCNELREAISRKCGLPGNSDPKAFEAANRELSPHYTRCYLNEGKFWRAFPDLMTPEQRAQFTRETRGGRR